MKKYLSISLLFVMVSCTMNVQDEGYLGTWNYTVDDAPFGFQKGKVIFYVEGDTPMAKLKVYGLSIHTENLIIDGANISFTTQVEHEEISIKLEMKDDSLIRDGVCLRGSHVYRDGEEGKKKP